MLLALISNVFSKTSFGIKKTEKKAKELLQSGDTPVSEREDEENRQKIYENKLSRSVVRQAVAKFQ